MFEPEHNTFEQLLLRRKGIAQQEFFNMTKYLVSALAAVAFGALSLPATTANAAPVAPFSLEQPGTGIEQAQMSRREMRHRRMMRQRMMRGRMVRGRMMRGRMMRRSAPSQAGNARNPSRPVMRQNQGMTTGGPRY